MKNNLIIWLFCKFIGLLDYWIILKGNIVTGVITKTKQVVKCKTVVLTNGTFLSGIIHIGEVNFEGGRIGELSSHGLTERLISIGFVSGKMKTGTPVRIDGRTVNFEKLTIQPSEDIFEILVQSPIIIQVYPNVIAIL